MKLLGLLNTRNAGKNAVKDLLMSKFYWKSNLEHKLRIFEIVILNTKWKDCNSHKRLVYEKFYVQEQI